jgi:hypothetical protein
VSRFILRYAECPYDGRYAEWHGAVVEPPTHDPKIEGSIPAAANTGKGKKMANEVVQFCCCRYHYNSLDN